MATSLFPTDNLQAGFAFPASLTEKYRPRLIIDDSFVLIDGAPIRVKLVCQTLSDRSEVYNLEVSNVR